MDPSKTKPLKILLVEDNHENRILFCLFLKPTPHQIDTAENGKTGIERFQAGDYDLVFMDMEMPLMNGSDATRRIRKWEKEQNRKPVPIIALTAHALKAIEKETLEAGYTDHLTKPFWKEGLFKVIEKYSTL
jgi:CheY-like chemotaxis protein